MKKSIAQMLNHNFDNGCFEIYENSNETYYEDSDGFWIKRKFDINNNKIYCEDSDGYWEKREFDSNNNEIYYRDSNGFLRTNYLKFDVYNMFIEN